MSIRVMTLVWEHSKHKGGDLIAMLAIADHADDHGIAYPSTDRLAQRTRMTRRNVIYVIQRLEKSQELTILHNAGPNGTNKYQINIGLLSGCENFSHAKISQGVKKFHVKNPDAKFHRIHQELRKEKKKDPPFSSPQGEKPRPSKTPPADFVITDAMRLWAATNVPGCDIDAETAVFLDHEFKDAHQDWQKVWRNWMRRAKKYAQNGTTSDSPEAQRAKFQASLTKLTQKDDLLEQ